MFRWTRVRRLPLNYLTAHFALTRRARLTGGERVLVHGAAGGVGTAACQLARAYGAVVIAVVSSAEKGRIAEAAGAHEIVFVDGFRDAVRRLTRGAGVDVIVDPVGGDRFLDSLRSLASEGRLLVLGFTSGTIPTVKVNRLLLGNTAVIGVGSAELWRREPGYLRQQWDELIPFLESRAIDPFDRPRVHARRRRSRNSRAGRASSDRQDADPTSLDGVPARDC